LPCSIAETTPSAPTLSTGVGSTSVISPGRLANASPSKPAIVASPARLRVPLLTAAHASTCVSIGAAPAVSTASRSIGVSPLIARP
jgi:hypothetical protein